jgi:hypothetical protein
MAMIKNHQVIMVVIVFNLIDYRKTQGQPDE